MEEWKEYKIEETSIEMIDGDRGKNYPKNNDFFTEGYCLFLNAGNVTKNGFSFSEKSFITREKDDALRKGRLERNDVIITTRGTIGNVALYDINIPFEHIRINSGMLILKSGKDILPEYLYYFLKGNTFQTQISQYVSGSAQPQLPKGTLAKMSISYPNNKDTQKRIIAILKSLDDKIEVNRRINEILEQQAQALFKSWFVDFEPFKDGEFEESDLGMIPKGWKVGGLGEICTQSSLKVGNRNDVRVLSPVTTGKLMLSEEYFTKQVYSESIAKYKVVNKGAFAYNPARVNIGSLGRNEYDFEGAVSPVYVVFECKKGYSNFFDLFRTTEKFKTEVLLRAIGGVRQSLNFVDFAMIQTIIAPQNVVDVFNQMFERIKTMQKHLETENESLANLRDTLLPKLMSGEIKDLHTDLINEMLEKGIR